MIEWNFQLGANLTPQNRSSTSIVIGLVDLTLLSKTYEGRDVVSRGPAAAASRELTPIGPMAVKPPEESAGPARNAQTSPIMAPVRDYQAEEAEALFVLPK